MRNDSGTLLRPSLLALVALALAGCSSGGMKESFDGLGVDAGSGSVGTTGGGGGSHEPGLGYEYEAFDLTRPTASANFVFVANTSRGTLAKIAVDDGGTIQISTVRVGAEPSLIVTTPDDDLALVLNSGASTVSIVDAAPVGEEDEVDTVDVIEGANRLSLAPDASVAFAWYDNRAAERGDDPGPLSELSAIVLGADPAPVYQLSVGVNVRDVVYDDAGLRAFVVTDEGVSSVALGDLDGDRFLPPVPIEDPLAPIPLGEDREILVAGEGDLALVRVGELPQLRVVELDTAVFHDFVLPAPPTDIDLLPGTRRAVLSMRESDQLGVLDLDAFGEAEISPITWFTIEGQPVGQTVLAPGGGDLLVFSAALDSERLSIVDLEAMEARTLNLRKGIRGAAIAPDGASAIVYHSKESGTPVAGEPEDQIIAKSEAFTVLDIESGLTKLVLTDAAPGEMTFDTEGGQAFVLVANEGLGVRALEWVDMRTFRTNRYRFDRTPEHVGVVPGAGMIWVSQIHDLGRIAFIDQVTGEVREITGFELNGLID